MKRLLLSRFFCCNLLISSFIIAYSRAWKNNHTTGNSRHIFTITPVYVHSEADTALKLEVINHVSTSNYTTINEEQIMSLNKLESRIRPQKRFHPPTSFQYILAHSNDLRQQIATPNSLSSSIGKPTKASFPVYTQTKFLDAYYSGSTSNRQIKLSEYDNKLSNLNFDYPSTSIELSEHCAHPFKEISFNSVNPYYNNEIIHSRTPDYHNFQHHQYHLTITTEEPKIMDQRVYKKPYSYYYIGKKLWYIPLYFSIYFIIYVTALVLKSIAMHKINFPTNLVTIAENARNLSFDSHNIPRWINYVSKVLESIEKHEKLY